MAIHLPPCKLGNHSLWHVYMEAACKSPWGLVLMERLERGKSTEISSWCEEASQHPSRGCQEWIRVFAGEYMSVVLVQMLGVLNSGCGLEIRDLSSADLGSIRCRNCLCLFSLMPSSSCSPLCTARIFQKICSGITILLWAAEAETRKWIGEIEGIAARPIPLTLPCYT